MGCFRGHVHMMSAQGGGTPKADAVWKLSKGGCVKMQTRVGSKNPTSYAHAPVAGPYPLLVRSPVSCTKWVFAPRPHVPFSTGVLEWPFGHYLHIIDNLPLAIIWIPKTFSDKAIQDSQRFTSLWMTSYLVLCLWPSYPSSSYWLVYPEHVIILLLPLLVFYKW